MTKTKTRLISAVIAVLVVAAALFLLLPSVLSTTASAEVWSGQSADSFATGEGTEANPYQITTAEELALMASKVNAGDAHYASAYYRLTADIVLNESLDGTPKEWTAIGTDATPFTGKFDGGGHTISGIFINKSSENYQGLFGYSSGTIMNVGVINSCICGGSNVGGVCGYNNGGTIEDCYNTGTVIAADGYVGGVCGQNQGGTIENCYSTGEVSGINEVGGVCGYNYSNSTIKNCYSTGAVNSTGGNNVGGVCGQNQGGTIENCYSTGKVIGTNIVGGVCGYNSSNSTITNCYSTGAVSAATNKVGGVCGQNNGTITNCYYNADFYTGSAYGGGTGTANNVTSKTTTAALCSSLPTGFEESVWTTGSYTADGKKATATFPQLKVFESTSAPTTTLSLYNFGTEEAPKWDTYTEISTAEALQNINNNLRCNYVLTTNITLTAPTEGESNWTAIGTKSAPFTGKFDGNGHTISGIVINSTSDYQGLFGYSSGTIMNVGVINSDITGANYVGGVCGKNLNGTITNCYSTGTVSGTGEKVGGVCGDNTGSIKNCYSIGAVSGSFNVGGVCGHNTGSIENCYSTGAVSGTGGYVGGICGYNYGDNYCPTIKNCYSTGTVSGREYVGGVCGYNNHGTIENCYSTGAVSAAGDYVGGVCGYNFSNSTIKNCYYDADFYTGNAIGNNQGTATNVTGISTAALCGSTLPTGFDSAVWTAGSAGSVTEKVGNFGKQTYTSPSLNGVGSAFTLEVNVYNFGTDEAPDWDTYTEISTADELQNINLSGNYVLTTDITLTAPTEGGSNWTAIGIYSTHFTGKFSGDGHTISGIVINKSSENYQGLFGYSTGLIMNVGVIDSSISGGNNVGGVCGRNSGTIKNCYSTGAVSAAGNNVGGVCGGNYGTIENCYSTGAVSAADNYVGGVCGDNYGTIENCYSTGAVSGSNYVGGVCGRNYSNGTIKNCYYDTDFYTGNAIGDAQGTADNVIGKTTAELCGSLDDLSFDSAVWTAGSFTIDPEDGKKATATFPQLKVFENTSAPKTTLSLYNFGTNGSDDWDTYTEISTAEALQNINNNLSGNYVLTADITLTAPAPGGSNWTAIGTYSNPFTGKFDGKGHTISGIVINKSGENDQGLFGYSTGLIMNVGVINSSISGGGFVGGVCGYNYGTIENCYSTGAVSGTDNNVGGVCGKSNGTIKNCYSTGSVSGSSWVGGVCGYNEGGTIENCYSTGAVSGTSTVGGVCGWNSSNSTIKNCYSTGAVSGTVEYIGGVCGYNDYNSTITNCYYLEGCNADGTTFSCNEGTSKTETQFKNGSVCYLLNGSTSTNPVWYQLLETENYPNLDSTNSANRTVYQCTPCTGVYSNEANKSAEHSYVVDTNDITKHICENCGVSHNAVFTADDTADTISVCCELGTVTLKAPTEPTYDGTAKAATVTGEIKGFTTPDIVYDSNSTTAPKNAGNHTASITYTYGGVDYSVSVEYTIKQAELTVSAGTYKVSKVYDGTTDAGTGNDGKFEISGLVGTDTVTITPTIGDYSSADVGTDYSIDVEISLTDASGNYTLSNTTVSVPAEITAKAITPTVEGSGTHTYTGSAITPNVTVKDGETVLEEDKDYTITVTNNINAGVATVTITAKSGGNYTFSERTLDFQIFKATPNVTAPTAKTGLVYNGTAKELISAGSTNFGTLVYSLNENGEYSTAIPKGTNAGTYTVYYKVQGNDNVNDSVAQTVSASIDRASVTVTAKDYIVKFGNPLPAKLECETTGLIGTDTLESIGANVTIGYKNAVTPSAIGNYTIVVSGEAATTNYTLNYVNGTLTIIEKPAQTITANDVTLSYGDTGKKIGAATSGDGAITYAVASGDDVIRVATDGTITALKAGTATVEITAAGTFDYAKATKTVTVTVNKKKVAVPTADSTEYTYNGKAQTYGVVSTDDYTVTGGTQTDAGNYPITITLNNENFEWDGVLSTYTFVIKKAAVTITANSCTVKVGNTLPKFDYKVSGLVNNEALPITVTVSCSATDSNTEGTYPITLTGAADSTNYTFTYVNGTLKITSKETQTITADDVTLTYGETGKKISATTNGDGAISYAVKTGSDVISVAADGTIKALKAGAATVEITAAETDAYEQATATITVTVNKAAVTIKANDKTVKQGAALPTFDYTVTGLANGDTLSFTPVLTCEATTTSTVGTYAITVTIEITEDECYAYTTQNGTLTVQKKSSGGGGGGGGGYTPSRPSTPNNPEIGGSAKSWSDVAADLGKLTNGSEATIELNGNTTVPIEVIKAIADKDSKVTFVINSVFSWVIDGAEITTPVAIDLTLIKTASTKSDTLRGIEGTQFKINGTNIPTDLMIAFNKEHEGKFANLYKVVDGKLVFVTCAKLGEDGKVILPDVVEKGDYVAMLCEFSDRLGDMDNDGVMNAKDASAILKDIVGLEPGKNPLMADFNGDGKVNAMDAAAILKRIVGLA